MKNGNDLPLIVLICVIAFGVGVFDMMAAVGILRGMDHSWTKIDLYCFLLSAPLFVLPLLIVGFSRRVAWSLLMAGVSLFTIGVPIMSVTTGGGLVAWSAGALVLVLGVSTLLILSNNKIVGELVKPKSQPPPTN